MRRFILQLCLLFTFMTAGIAVFNAVVDPSGFFHLQRGVDSGLEHPVYADPRLAKPLGAVLLHPNTIIAGTSRTGLGFSANTAHAFPDWGLVYNFSIPGVQMLPLYERLQPLLGDPALQRLVLGLDYGMFFINRERIEQPIRLVEQPRLARASLPDLLWVTRTLLLSKTMLTASLRSWLPDATQRRHTDLLGYQQTVPQQQRVQQLGHHQTALNLERHLAPVWFNSKKSPESPYQRHLHAFSQLLDEACRQGVHVYAFINPFHVRQMELLHKIGLQKAHTEWKRDLLHRLDHHVQAGCASPLMDFSGVNAITTENFPAPGDRLTRMYGWWESSHYTHAVGERILYRLVHRDEPSSEGFGRRLDEDVLERMEFEWSRYRDEHQALLSDVPGVH